LRVSFERVERLGQAAGKLLARQLADHDG
jgi:hypothetical protein